MEGKGDPGSRGPMRWELNTPDNPELTFVRKLLAIRKAHPALRIGDYVALDSDKLLAFSRQTDKALEGMVVVVNPSQETVREAISCRDGRLMNGGQLHDELSGETITTYSGIANVTVPPLTARIYSYVAQKGYTPYKRMH
jgi:glycosidase